MLIMMNQYLANRADGNSAKFYRRPRIQSQNGAIKIKNEFLSLGEPSRRAEKQDPANAQSKCDANENTNGSWIGLFAHKNRSKKVV
jgi:hypothetical protein